MAYWLSYGGGVNSTALAVMTVTGQLPQYQDCRYIFADTGNEKPDTYDYLRYFSKWLASYDKEIIIVHPPETVLQRWQRYEMTGSRKYRSCTDHGKRRPIETYIRENDHSPEQLFGISAEERHRAKSDGKWPVHYPLVDFGIDRDGCVEIIKAAGLCVPVKSGCRFCPFMRSGEIMELANTEPDQFNLIVELEEACRARMAAAEKSTFFHWRDKPATYWQERAAREARQGRLDLEWDDIDPNIPCQCLD